MKKPLLSSLLILFALSGIAQAHPGHGATQDSGSMMHFVSEPLHILPLVAIMTIVVCFSIAIYKRRDSAQIDR